MVSQLYETVSQGPVWKEVSTTGQEDGGTGSYMSWILWPVECGCGEDMLGLPRVSEAAVGEITQPS